MKLKSWILGVTLALASVAHAATNDLTGLLQKGLFEEEANRDLTAAIANYQSLASAFDKDRQLAATAIFRLGECYRKLGKTNEAVVQYERIVKEFSDQQTLATLSRQNLSGLNAAPKTSVASSDNSSLLEAESAKKALLQAQLQAIGKMSHDQVRVFVQQNFSNQVLSEAMMNLVNAERDLIKLKLDYQPDHPKYKNAQELVDSLNTNIDAQVNGVVQGLQDKLAATDATLTMLRNGQSEVTREGDGSSAAPESAITDEEQQEIRRIKAMIQNSPDLINAPSGGPGGSLQTPLWMAAGKGQLVVAKYLLDHGADVNGGEASKNNTPLYAAAENGHKAMVELLIARGANVNAGRLSPLYTAVGRGFVGVAEVLLANHADPNLPDANSGGARPLHNAAGAGRTDLIQLLLGHGADVNVADGRGQSPLECAAAENQTNVARMLLAAKANTEMRDKEGNTALHLAAGAGHVEMVSLLLNAGASVNATNEDNSTPLPLAVAACAKINTFTPASSTMAEIRECVRVLLQHKADPNHPGTLPNWRPNLQQVAMRWKGSPVYFALAVKDNEVLKLLLDAGASPEGDSASAFVPLFWAINDNNVDAVQLLLQHGANPNCVQNGYPALNIALINNKDKSIVVLLLDKGANPNTRDSDGMPALFRTSNPEVGRWLVEHKADVNARLSWGKTLLMNPGDTNYLKFLLEAGAKVDLQDTNGNTALHEEAWAARLECAAILLEHKANPNIQNNAGYTPLDVTKAGSEGNIPYGIMNPNNTGSSTSVSAEREKKLSDLLVQAGGLANLPKRDRIEVRRAADTARTILKDSAGRNRYSLLEVVANAYGIISQASGESRGTLGALSGTRNMQRFLPFPDFKKVVIYRRTENSAKQTMLNINLENILDSGDCSRDVWLEWGDIVEIPEADHPVDEGWHGLTDKVTTSLIKCVTRQVTFKIKGESTTLDLLPKPVASTPGVVIEFRPPGTPSFKLLPVLNNSKLIRVSSDLSRVKVTRTDPATKKTAEWDVDCTSANDLSDLWLRDRDVIEVPEK